MRRRDMHAGGPAPVRLHKLGMGRAPRIAIVGAGVGGLTLAGILSRKLPRARLSILERHPRIDGCDHEGGYGLSVDEFGQEALVRAGLFDRFWSISRPRSDLVRLFPLQGAEPIHTSWPRYVECETNRAGLRSVLLEALAERKAAPDAPQGSLLVASASFFSSSVPAIRADAWLAAFLAYEAMSLPHFNQSPISQRARLQKARRSL